MHRPLPAASISGGNEHDERSADRPRSRQGIAMGGVKKRVIIFSSLWLNRSRRMADSRDLNWTPLVEPEIVKLLGSHQQL